MSLLAVQLRGNFPFQKPSSFEDPHVPTAFFLRACDSFFRLALHLDGVRTD